MEARLGPPPLSKYQKFRVERLPRSMLRPAPYNPRNIDKSARNKLNGSLSHSGLVEALVWNRTTGNLVSGHQRLNILDEKEGGTDYSLDVAVVEMEEGDERALNVFLNNVSAQGGFDYGKLEEMLKDEQFPLDARWAGFDALDIEAFFPDLGKTGLFNKANDDAQQDIDKFKQMAGARPRAVKGEDDGRGGGEGSDRDADGQGDDVDEVAVSGDSDAEPGDAADTHDSHIAHIKEQKKAAKEKARNDNRSDYYVSIVFPDHAYCSAFLKAVGFSDGEQFLDGKRLCELLNIKLDVKY